ncbi:MAG TPA: hypothetical protein PLP06_12105 [Saprospiraceae bacterium]|nr:hypothetical protein [Saprospiraceae bacterium]
MSISNVVPFRYNFQVAMNKAIGYFGRMVQDISDCSTFKNLENVHR